MPARAKITVTWDGDLIPCVDRKLGRMTAFTYEILEGLGERAVGVARGLAPVETGNYKRALQYRRNLLRGKIGIDVLSGAPHAHLVEVGRKPGKAPPAALIGQRFGLGKEEAFRVAMRIGVKGTKGRKVIAKTKKQMAASTLEAHIRLGTWLNDLDAA